MKRLFLYSMATAGVIITGSTVMIAIASRSVSQELDGGTSVCYLRIQGRSTQDLTYLCGRKSGTANINGKSPVNSPRQPLTSPNDDSDDDTSDEPLTPTPQPLPSTRSNPLPPKAVSPARSPVPIRSVPPTAPSPSPAPTQSPQQSAVPRTKPPANQASKPVPTDLAANPVSDQTLSDQLPTTHHRENRPFARSRLAKPPVSKSNPQTLTAQPESSPLLPVFQPLASSLSTHPSLLDTVLQAKYFYLFWLICLQIPLLKVVTGRLSTSNSKTQLVNSKINRMKSAWQRLKQQRLSRQPALELVVNEQSGSNHKLLHANPQKMDASTAVVQSAWQQLKQQKMSCEQALALLVNQRGMVNFDLLDREVSHRFLRHFPEKTGLPPVVPLLLWRNCYYLGSPVTLSEQEIQQLNDSLNATVKIIAIAEKSFRQWTHRQHLKDNQRLKGTAMVTPLTEPLEPEDITQVAEYQLSQVDNQVERIKALISSALRNRASDIHLAPAPDGLRVRFRIDGILRHVTTLPADISRRVIVSLKVMCDMDISESRRPQDGRISEKYMAQQQEEGLDLRVSTVPCVGGTKGEAAEKAVLRLLRQKNSFVTIDDLGFSGKALDIYKGWLKEPQGMVILTGPTGSGKTSTLYTSLQAIATESVNIITVEDPVEYVLPGITQIQVHDAAGMTFAAGLRAILRQDPDILMLGEIRDSETAETATRAALTGHLVLTTLHTNDAIGAIPRLRDMGLDPGLISDALLGVVAQRLIRKVCPHCSEPYTPTQAEFDVLGISKTETNPQDWRKGKGCPHCFNTGYLGREAIIELLNVDNTMRQIIHEGTILQLHRYLNQIQFDSFRSSAIAKVTTGVTTVEEVRRVLPYSVLGRRSTNTEQDPEV